jgi:regulator of sigma E protease
MIGWYLVGILALALLMVVHEAGHFFTARAYGMRVSKFSIGVGPTFLKVFPKDGYFWLTVAADSFHVRLWRHDPERHGPTVYQVAMIPILAYVQIAGMNPLEEIDPADKGSYANARLTGRIATIFAGPLANYLFASVFFFTSLMIGGKPDPSTDPSKETEIRVVAGMPAAAANIKDGDRIVEVDGVVVENWTTLKETISRKPGNPIPVVVLRGGERIQVTVTPANKDGAGMIGVERAMRMVPVSAKEAAVLAAKMPVEVVRLNVVGLIQMAAGKATAEVGGAGMAIDELAHAAKRGLRSLFDLLGMLSAILALFNMLPFPALDGGRLMFLFYEATTRRRPNTMLEAYVNMFGAVTLIVLTFYVIVAKDIPRFIK